MKKDQYAGLVGTNTIRQNYSRMGGLDYIVEKGGTILDSVSTEVWSGDAVVYVSIATWKKGEEKRKKVLSIQTGDSKDSPFEDYELDTINSALSLFDVTQAKVLKCNKESSACYQGQTHGNKHFLLTKEQADSMRLAWNLSTRPTAIAQADSSLLNGQRDLGVSPATMVNGKYSMFNGQCSIFFSTGKDIRCKNKECEETVISPTKDVSAMAFTPDGTLWLATIYGQLYRYHDGKTEPDDYGSNEYGDGVIAMCVDSLGRLLLVSDRYTRIYDPKRRTLRQQSREADGIYCIELQETKSGERWSQPNRDKVVERMPQWIWWMLAILILALSLLSVHVIKLRKQRKRFLEQLKNAPSLVRESAVPSQIQPAPSSVQESAIPSQTSLPSSWLNKAIAQVEAHLSDEGYTVEQLSSDMCMSRMTFYRKIQSATGHTPTEFMRTIRLRRAAEMLQEARLTVTEISYATGFSSVSYFSRCFRALYGVPPTQYGTQHQA